MNRIEDYALIGDCHSAALVGVDGSIDWACFPRFDSPSVFARVLDDGRGGSFQIRPRDVRSVERAYLDGTNVLRTTFTTLTGTVELVDCMPVGRLAPQDLTRVHARGAILRKLTCTDGSVDIGVAIAPRFEYGANVPLFRLTSPTTGMIVGGADAMWITATHRLDWDEEALSGAWHLDAGDDAWIEAFWTPSNVQMAPTGPASPATLQQRLDDTVAFWRDWLARCSYDGEHREAVRRSALVLKALQYAPTGAVVAAPTTSLPEHIGGERNWDYRYTWIRDATLTLTSLFVLGFTAEADAFKLWLERASAGRPRDLQIMYGIGGERLLPEFILPHLDGHRGSGPVRIGNAAARQVQLDMYGQILQAAYLYVLADGQLNRRDWAFLSDLAEIVCERWMVPDQGIWEVRGPPRHFTHSKLTCWKALDRAIKLAKLRGYEGPTARWEAMRDRIRDYLLNEASPDGWFRQAAEVDAPDAAALLAPAFGFLAVSDPRVRATIDRVREELEHDGLVDRYRVPDGLAGGEGAFLLCSFWLVDCFTFAGELDRAGSLLDKLLGLANDVGLYAEEADVQTGAPLGNFPQAFTHMALVTSCAHLSAARRGQIPFGEPTDFAEHALHLLLSTTGRSPLTVAGPQRPPIRS
ncbi:MAG: glycoside hydrolase family 15 protein [Euzebyales bacterium]|nr:glycoside hydrolase family 15 protein [Euzebyales bacterium]